MFRGGGLFFFFAKEGSEKGSEGGKAIGVGIDELMFLFSFSFSCSFFGGADAACHVMR